MGGPGGLRRAAVLAGAAAVLAGCTGSSGSGRSPSASPSSASSSSSSSSSSAPPADGTASAGGGPSASTVPPTTRAPDGPTATLAVAGDVHFEGASRSTTDLGSAFEVLADADVAVVNLETAVTTGGDPVPGKQYVFRAPPSALGALAAAGVDVVSLANNHGEDYGRSGLADTLAAARAADLPLIGAGDDEDAAFAPFTTTVSGLRIAVVAATDVLDSSVTTAWTATATQPGLASAKDADRLVQSVRAAQREADVVVVFLHWGQERRVCPTPRQQQLAARLVRAGAAAVVGSHAHVLQPTAEVGGAFVAYGLGNFHFYARGGPGAQTGVLTLELDRDGVVGSTWHPAVIEDGRPELLTGAAAAARADELPGLCAAATAAG